MKTDKSQIKRIAEDALLFRTWGVLLALGTTRPDAIETLVDTYPQYKVPLTSLNTWLESHNHNFEGFSSENIDGSAEDQSLFSSPILRKMLILQDERGELEDYLLDISKHLELKIECYQRGLSDQQTNKILFYDALETFLGYGYPLSDCIRKTMDCFSFPPSEVHQGIIEKVEGPYTLAKAMAKYPEHFQKLDIQMIWCGEAGGVLEKALTQLIDIYKSRSCLKG